MPDQITFWSKKIYSSYLVENLYLSQGISRSQGKSSKNGYVIANDLNINFYLPPVFIFGTCAS